MEEIIPKRQLSCCIRVRELYASRDGGKEGVVLYLQYQSV